jgi:hypothetical protein
VSYLESWNPTISIQGASIQLGEYMNSTPRRVKNRRLLSDFMGRSTTYLPDFNRI